MHKKVMLLPLTLLLLSSVNAEDTRDQVRNDILKSFNEAVQAREATINELNVAVQTVDNERAKRSEDNTTNSHEVKIAETKAIATISESVADVEISKIQAKEKIVKAVLDVKENTSGVITPEEMEKEKATAVKKIAKAVSRVEVAKAKAVQNIIK